MSSTQDEVKKQTNPEILYTYPTEDFVHSKILEYIPVLKGPTIPLWVTVFQEQRIMTLSTVRLMCVFSHDLILN